VTYGSATRQTPFPRGLAVYYFRVVPHLGFEPPVPPMSKVTRILSAIEQGDPHAAEQLLPLVYDELRQLAAEKLAQERPGQTLSFPRLMLVSQRDRSLALNADKRVEATIHDSHVHQRDRLVDGQLPALDSLRRLD